MSDASRVPVSVDIRQLFTDESTIHEMAMYRAARAKSFLDVWYLPHVPNGIISSSQLHNDVFLHE